MLAVIILLVAVVYWIGATTAFLFLRKWGDENYPRSMEWYEDAPTCLGVITGTMFWPFLALFFACWLPMRGMAFVCRATINMLAGREVV